MIMPSLACQQQRRKGTVLQTHVKASKNLQMQPRSEGAISECHDTRVNHEGMQGVASQMF